MDMMQQKQEYSRIYNPELIIEKMCQMYYDVYVFKTCLFVAQSIKGPVTG
jgi:hypothetical protein